MEEKIYLVFNLKNILAAGVENMKMQWEEWLYHEDSNIPCYEIYT